MARHKDGNWNLPDQPNIDEAALGLLMDLRDELKLLNRHLATLVGLSMSIRRNTAWSRKA